MGLSPQERHLLGKTVTTIQDSNYGGKVGIVRANSRGVVVDFGASSGDPVVKLSDGRKVIVKWNNLRQVN